MDIATTRPNQPSGPIWSIGCVVVVVGCFFSSSFFLSFLVLKSPLGCGGHNGGGNDDVGDGGGGWLKKNAISPFLDASGNKNIGASIRIGQEIRRLLYAGFFPFKIPDLVQRPTWEAVAGKNCR